MSPKLIVRAIVAEHFAQPGSMEKSREAALRVTRAMKSDVPVLNGENAPGEAGEISEGVRFILRSLSCFIFLPSVMLQINKETLDHERKVRK